MSNDIPLAMAILTVCSYWGTVILLALYQRLRRGRSAGMFPRSSYEKRLWYLIVPVIGAWISLPMLARTSQLDWLALPGWAHEATWAYTLRSLAAGAAAICYLMSLYCWLLMGRNWSMAVVSTQSSQLITSGLYRWVRHPIYGLQVGLMLATAVAVPTAPMALLACLHLLAMNLKARHEEKHLAKSFGPAYVDYCNRVGRFWPRWVALLGK